MFSFFVICFHFFHSGNVIQEGQGTHAHAPYLASTNPSRLLFFFVFHFWFRLMVCASYFGAIHPDVLSNTCLNSFD